MAEPAQASAPYLLAHPAPVDPYFSAKALFLPLQKRPLSLSKFPLSQQQPFAGPAAEIKVPMA